MPTIHISEELYRSLLSIATSFHDTEESVIKRLIAKYKGDSIPVENEVSYSPDYTRRRKITIKQIREIYSCVNYVIEGSQKGKRDRRIALETALDYLASEEIGMNRGSARIYINFLAVMKQGEKSKNKMSINNVALDYFMEQILADDGKSGLKIALGSLLDYINHCEEKYGGTMIVFKEIHDKYQAKLKE